MSRREIMELIANTSDLSLAQAGPENITGAANCERGWEADSPQLGVPPAALPAAPSSPAPHPPLPPHLTTDWIDVYDAAGETLALRIWVLDSMDRSCEGVGGGWGCVASDTVAWVNETAPTLEPAEQSIAFVHIPRAPRD